MNIGKKCGNIGIIIKLEPTVKCATSNDQEQIIVKFYSFCYIFIKKKCREWC